MNDFCEYCVGGQSKECIKEICECDDTCCPFYSDRYENLPYQNWST